jgi:hypothetical protein
MDASGFSPSPKTKHLRNRSLFMGWGIGEELGALRFFQTKSWGDLEFNEDTSITFKNSLIIDEEKNKKKSDLHINVIFEFLLLRLISTVAFFVRTYTHVNL